MNCHEEVRVQLRQSPVKPCYLETPSTPGFWQKCYGTELTMAIFMSYHHLSLATSREQNKLGFPRINYYAASWKISYFRFVLGNKCMIGRTILCMSGISGIIEYGEITPVCKFHIIICVMLNMFNFLMSTGHNFNLFSLLTRTRHKTNMKPLLLGNKGNIRNWNIYNIPRRVHGSSVSYLGYVRWYLPI